MRKQYYFRQTDQGLMAWDVDRLVELTRNMPCKRVALSAIRELDELWFGDGERPTWRFMLEHMRLIRQADLRYPIILSAHGRVMDGMHRVAKAALEDRQDIEAVQFDKDPLPDHVNVHPNDLTY